MSRFACYTHTKIGGECLQVGLQKLPLVHVAHLTHQVDCEAIRRPSFFHGLHVAVVIAPDNQDVVDAEVVKLDEEIFCFLPSEASAKDMGNRIHIVFVLNERANA
jgi:hypothetical protein